MAQDPVETIDRRDPTQRIEPIQRVGLAIKPGELRALEAVRSLAKWLADRDVEALFDTEVSALGGEPGCPRSELAMRCDLIAVFGGDGTFLSVAREVGGRRVPLLGINLGTLGFLAELSIGEVEGAFEAILRGEMRVETRTRLVVAVIRDGQPVEQYLALNDAVIAKGGVSRLIDLEVMADGKLVSAYHADGLIVATPTGSTAYSLSAGGPIVLPSVGALILNPICPHALTQRPLMLPDSVTLEISVTRPDEEIQLTVDGQETEALREGDRVRVGRSSDPISVVVSQHSRFEVLRTKLRWGER